MAWYDADDEEEKASLLRSVTVALASSPSSSLKVMAAVNSVWRDDLRMLWLILDDRRLVVEKSETREAEQMLINSS